MIGKGAGIGLLSGVLWGLTPVLFSLVLFRVSVSEAYLFLLPIVLAAFHDVFSAFFLCVFCVIRKEHFSFCILFKEKKGFFLLLAALFGAPVGMSCYVSSIQYLGAAPAAILSATYPIWGVVFAILLGRDRLRPHMFFGILLAVGCTVMLSYEPFSLSGEAAVGVLLALLCAAGWGAECVLSSFCLDEDVPTHIVLMIRQVVSALGYFGVVLPLCGAYEVVTPMVGGEPELLLWMAVVCLFGTGSYYLYYLAISKIGPIRAMGLNITYSAWATFFSLILLSTYGDWQSWLACFGIIFGALLTVADRREWATVFK